MGSSHDKLYNIADNYLNGRLNIIKETWKSGTGEIVTQYIINQKEKNKYTYDTFVEVFQLVCYENPQFFFLSPELVANDDEIALTVYPKFSTREKLSNGIKKVVNKLNWYIMSVGTEVILNVQDEIAEYLARKIHKNITYDYEGAW